MDQMRKAVAIVTCVVTVCVCAIMEAQASQLQASMRWRTFITSVVSMTVTLTNDTEEVVTILWDESALVLPDGTSERIIHTGVLFILQSTPQAPTAIAPHTSTSEAIWPAKYAKWNGKHWHLTKIPLHRGESLQLYLTWQDSGGRHTSHYTWYPQSYKMPAWVPILAVLVVLSLIGQAILPEA